jgi:predicted nuclease of predicted toxin-antitoxin system
VLELANFKRAILLTVDKDFGELIYRDERESFHGVVLLRLAGLISQEKAEIVITAFRKHGPELEDSYSVVSKAAVRIRPKHES